VSGLCRLRMVLVAAMMAVLAVVAGNIFDRQVWWLLIAVALPALMSISVRNFANVVRFILAVLGIGASVTIIVFATGGQASDVVDALTAGTQQLLSTDWPSPDRPELIGTVGLLLAIPTAAAVELAGRREWHLLALTPVVVAGALVTALGAPSGEQMIWLIPIGLLTAAFATLRPMTGDDSEIGDRWALLRGERRLIPVVLLAGLVAAAVSVPTVLADRADPRRNEPAQQTAPLLDPIEATLALRALDPPADLYQVTTESGVSLPNRWRTAALSDYDGQRWTPTLTLRPIGRRLTPDTSDMFMFDLAVLDDDLALVPFPATPITIDAPVETDNDRTVVRLSQRIGPDVTIAVSSGPITTSADASGALATRPIDESVSSLTEFAETLAGDGTVLEQLRQIESTMRNDWVLASDAPGAGLQRALLERFIRDTQRGTAEQFSTAYVLLARSLGVDARVATGFVSASPPTGSTLTLVSNDAAVWPEVGLLDGRWIAFDSVPPNEASDETPPPEEPAVQTPAAAQPPIALPPELARDAPNDNEADNNASTTDASLFVRWAQDAGVALTAILLPLLTLAAIILLAKFRLRRRRIRSGTPAQRIAGAWAVATDRLVDAGLTIAPSSTNEDISTAGAPLAANAKRELAQLATLSSAVIFGNPAETDFLVEDAVAYLSKVETSMAEVRTRGEQLRWRLSLRSLRPSTRSPVR
jgi:hypothetical protein